MILPFGRLEGYAMNSDLLHGATAPIEDWPDLVPLDTPNLPHLDLQHLPAWAGDYARAWAVAVASRPL